MYIALKNLVCLKYGSLKSLVVFNKYQTHKTLVSISLHFSCNRCVDESVCRNLWISHSSTQNNCVNFGSVLVTGNYSCHFCCTSDDCNTGLLPDATTFYTAH